MIISTQQFRDLLLFGAPEDAWEEIGDRSGLTVREFVVTIEPREVPTIRSRAAESRNYLTAKAVSA